MQTGVSWSCLGNRWYPTTTTTTTTPPLIKSAALLLVLNKKKKKKKMKIIIRCCSSEEESKSLKTCKNCKTQFDPSLNNPLACRFHTCHFGGETKRKFESVHTGGTMNTPNSGQLLEYWHCCGSEDPFHPGCTSSPHLSYDDH